MTDKLAIIEKSVNSFIGSHKTDLEKCAERDYDLASFLRSFRQAIVNNDDLSDFLKNDESKQSLYNAARYAAATGLSLNPLQGKAALIVRNQKKGNEWIKVITYQIMKDGMIDLAMETGEVRKIRVDTVRENDVFEIEHTDEGDKFTHSPARNKRGNIDGHYCAVKMANGESHVLYMSSDEVEFHRSSFSAKTSMPVEGYGLKTVVKKCLSNLNVGTSAKAGLIAENQSTAETDTVTAEYTEVTGSRKTLENLTEKTETEKPDDSPI